MPFDYHDCIKANLLRKIPPSTQKAFQWLKKAKFWLTESKKSLEGSATSSSIIASYMCMFHAAGSILFFEGYREKSHACIARYLEEKYVKNNVLDKKWVELLDHSRETRHNDQYNLSFFSTGDDADNALESAKSFLNEMESLLKKISK